jgi:hypothetical protein
MDDAAADKTSIRQRAQRELKAFLIVAGYFYVCFTALAYLKAAILQAYGIAFAPFGFAAVKALICAKFMSIGYVFHLGDRYKKEALIWPILHRSLAFLVLLIVLNVSEVVIVGYFHDRPLAPSIAEIGGGTLHQLIATAIIMLLILVPFFAFRSLADVIGGRVLFRLFFEPRRKLELAPIKARERDD